MFDEGLHGDKKSLRSLNDIKELAKDCVAFANAVGGTLVIGIEDDATLPPESQLVTSKQVESFERRVSECTLNVGVTARKRVASNGGEYIEAKIFPSRNSIAATSDGRYFLRVSDQSRPLLPEELSRLTGEKTAFDWESHVSRKVPLGAADGQKLLDFVDRVRRSKRVSDFVRSKTEEELLGHYLMSDGQHLTNLGILMVGSRADRARLQYAPIIQAIKFDEQDRKVNKWLWDDYQLNPIELIEAVWNEVPDWQESQEIPDGLLRTTVPHYDEVVVRELLCNALVHRPYTQRGDIFLNLYVDRLELHNPGLLPLGVTPANILHTSVKRNEHLAKVFYDLGYMEREGSGYDRIYEVLVSTGKRIPKVVEENDRVTVSVYKRILRPETLDFTTRASQTFDLTQKETICLGLVAQHESITAINLTKSLALPSAEDLRPWLDRLLKWRLVSGRGRTKGREYYVEPELLRNFSFQGTTSLKGIENHRLRELLLRDLEIYKNASSTQIQSRIGDEIGLQRIRKALESLISDGKISRVGEKRWTRYIYPPTEE